MLEALQDPEHAALVGWIVSAALVLVGLLSWVEINNRRDHRDLGQRIDKLNGRVDDLFKLLLERLPKVN